jgi:hypothetical protein
VSKKRKKFQKRLQQESKERKKFEKKWIIQRSFNWQILAKNSNPFTKSDKKIIKNHQIFRFGFQYLAKKI